MSLLLTPNSSFKGKVLRLPLRLIPKSHVATVRAGITAGMKWRVGSSIHGCWLGTYELSKQAVFSQALKPGMNVMDVGANAGFYSLAAARSANHVWAFEPLASNVVNLLDHIELNSLSNVSVMQAAIADRTALVGFQIAENNAMGKIADSRYMVPALSLDSLLETLPVPDLVKIDVEGGELAVLLGAANMLRMRRTTWLVALDGPSTRQECRRLLDEAGYVVREFEVNEIIATPRASSAV